MNSCAFTDHRSSRFTFGNDEKQPLCNAIKRALLEQCERLYKEEYVRTFYSGCALGVDLWGAGAVLYLKERGCPDIKLVCATPYPNHDGKWPKDQRERLNKIITATNETVTVCGRYSDDAYKQRNYYMVDRSQFLIAVFDWQKNQRSGTQQTVNYAKKKNLNITYIHPDTAVVSK